ncbi:MAG TPA: hypothetical protein VGE01_08935 [Fimbriimonas sp.]
MKSCHLVALGVLAVAVLGGCRFKGGESFTSATAPHETGAGYEGDPYASSGSAEATGGLKVDAPYSAGARTSSTDPIDPTYNRPAYGSGERRGELGAQGAPGHSNTNAPAFQPGPNTGPGANP